jgi:hypothetical protein
MTVMVRETDHLKHPTQHRRVGEVAKRENEEEREVEENQSLRAFMSKWFAASFTCDTCLRCDRAFSVHLHYTEV